MMASFGKRLTRFVAAQTIRAVQIRILRVLGKGLCSAHDISDQALWPKLQGKLNREWRIYRMDLPFWQSGSLSLLGVPLILRLISAAFRCDVDLQERPIGAFRRRFGGHRSMRRTIPLCLLAVVSALAQPAAAVERQAA